MGIVALEGHQCEVTAMCAVPVGGRTLLASGGSDGTVLLWDPAAGTTPVAALPGHQGPVDAVCAVPVGDRTLLASASYDKTVRLWDPSTTGAS